MLVLLPHLTCAISSGTLISTERSLFWLAAISIITRYVVPSSSPAMNIETKKSFSTCIQKLQQELEKKEFTIDGSFVRDLAKKKMDAWAGLEMEPSKQTSRTPQTPQPPSGNHRSPFPTPTRKRLFSQQ